MQYNKLQLGVRISSIEVNKSYASLWLAMSSKKLQQRNPSMGDSFLRKDSVFSSKRWCLSALKEEHPETALKEEHPETAMKARKRHFLTDLRTSQPLLIIFIFVRMTV